MSIQPISSYLPAILGSAAAPRGVSDVDGDHIQTEVQTAVLRKVLDVVVEQAHSMVSAINTGPGYSASGQISEISENNSHSVDHHA